MPDENPPTLPQYPQPTRGIPLPDNPKMGGQLMKMAKYSMRSKGHTPKATRPVKGKRDPIKVAPGKFY